MTWLAKLMLICVKPSIWNCSVSKQFHICIMKKFRQHFKIAIITPSDGFTQISINCRSMLHSTHCIHQLHPHWNLCKRTSALLTALLLSPTATIISTNIHLFYNVFLMEHINCLFCCLACYSLLLIFHVFPFLL